MRRKVLVFRRFFLRGIICMSVICNSCKGENKNYEPTYSVDTLQNKTLLYGVPTQAHYGMHAAFVKYLNDHISAIHIRTVASSNFSAYVDKLNGRFFDVALANGVLALDSTRLGYSILGTSVEEEANAGVILVHKDSSINHISDLKDKTVATTGSPALGGHMLPMLYLFKNGLNVNKQIRLKYFESFESVILNMYLGKCSVGFSTLNGWNTVVKKRPEIASKVAIRWTTPAVVGNPLLIRNNIGEDTVGKIKNLIFTMHLNEGGRKALADLGYRKFVPADSNTYKPFREFLKEYHALIIEPKR